MVGAGRALTADTRLAGLGSRGEGDRSSRRLPVVLSEMPISDVLSRRPAWDHGISSAIGTGATASDIEARPVGFPALLAKRARLLRAHC